MARATGKYIRAKDKSALFAEYNRSIDRELQGHDDKWVLNEVDLLADGFSILYPRFKAGHFKKTAKTKFLEANFLSRIRAIPDSTLGSVMSEVNKFDSRKHAIARKVEAKRLARIFQELGGQKPPVMDRLMALYKGSCVSKDPHALKSLIMNTSVVSAGWLSQIFFTDKSKPWAERNWEFLTSALIWQPILLELKCREKLLAPPDPGKPLVRKHWSVRYLPGWRELGLLTANSATTALLQAGFDQIREEKKKNRPFSDRESTFGIALTYNLTGGVLRLALVDNIAQRFEPLMNAAAESVSRNPSVIDLTRELSVLGARIMVQIADSTGRSWVQDDLRRRLGLTQKPASSSGPPKMAEKLPDGPEDMLVQVAESEIPIPLVGPTADDILRAVQLQGEGLDAAQEARELSEY